jgi:hypothetical protein
MKRWSADFAKRHDWWLQSSDQAAQVVLEPSDEVFSLESQRSSPRHTRFERLALVTARFNVRMNQSSQLDNGVLEVSTLRHKVEVNANGYNPSVVNLLGVATKRESLGGHSSVL